MVFSAVCDKFCLSLRYLGNGWTDLCQIHREDMFGPSLRRVWMSRSKVKSQGHQGQKTENCWVISARQDQYLWNGWTICAKLLVWSLAQMSLKVEVKGQGYQGQKRARYSHYPWQWRNGTRLLQMTWCISGRHHSVVARGGFDFGGFACGVCLVSK